MKQFAILLAAAGLSACSLAPTYQTPQTPAVEQYKEAGDWQPAQPADATVRGAWWTVFGDQQLNALQQRAATSNLGLQAAAARYAQARAVADEGGAALFPVVGLDAGGQRQRIAASQNARGTGPSIGNALSLRAQMSYELDFWGAIRNSAARAAYSADASGAELETARLSLQSELAADWFLLTGLDAQTELLESAIAAYADAARITEQRHQGGAAALTDVYQARTQLENARVQLGATRLSRARLEHAIAILLGEVPSKFSLPRTALALEPPAVASGLPSQLLERRPDVAAAERRVAAANAQIGVARAAWFPAFTLGGAAGYAGAPGSWLTAPNLLWSVGPQAALTLFDGGRRSAQQRGAQAAYDESVATYKQSVLTAYGEVEDQLAAIHWLDDQRLSQSRAVESSGHVLEQANNRYKGGIATYLEVTSAQTASLQARQADLNLRVQRLNASVGLIRALGGSWKAS
ncbi:efflux transporter outer membrane subunit [Pseudoduganella sp. RAF19]|uniref:efflux transporter outer membrane subunit n=1 Tax=Pseudoduganella sp. RAF19 TaxID=3233052 RepID=UPI003F975306